MAGVLILPVRNFSSVTTLHATSQYITTGQSTCGNICELGGRSVSGGSKPCDDVAPKGGANHSGNGTAAYNTGRALSAGSAPTGAVASNAEILNAVVSSHELGDEMTPPLAPGPAEE